MEQDMAVKRVVQDHLAECQRRLKEAQEKLAEAEEHRIQAEWQAEQGVEIATHG